MNQLEIALWVSTILLYHDIKFYYMSAQHLI